MRTIDTAELTPIEIEGPFVLGYRGARLHLPRETYAGARFGAARLIAKAMCGAELLRATSVLDAPDGLILCDDCVLADLPGVVYRFFDAGDVLLYVGFASSWPSRLRTHFNTSPWFPAVVRWTLVEFTDPVAGIATIRDERPLHNVRHNPAAPARSYDRYAAAAA